MEDIEDIMKDNMDSPDVGVDELIAYTEKHGPDTVKILLEAGIHLSNNEGDGDREERIKEIEEKFKTPIKNFKGTAEKFGKQVNKNKEAKEKLEDFSKKWKSLGETMASSLFTSYNEAGDRVACISNMATFQKAMRGYANLNQLEPGSPINWNNIQEEGFVSDLNVKCPSGGTYTRLNTVTEQGIRVLRCSHEKDLNHRPKDTSNW